MACGRVGRGSCRGGGGWPPSLPSACLLQVLRWPLVAGDLVPADQERLPAGANPNAGPTSEVPRQCVSPGKACMNAAWCASPPLLSDVDMACSVLAPCVCVCAGVFGAVPRVCRPRLPIRWLTLCLARKPRKPCPRQSDEAPEQDGYLYAFGIVITGMAQSLLHQWVRPSIRARPVKRCAPCMRVKSKHVVGAVLCNLCCARSRCLNWAVLLQRMDPGSADAHLACQHPVRQVPSH